MVSAPSGSEMNDPPSSLPVSGTTRAAWRLRRCASRFRGTEYRPPAEPILACTVKTKSETVAEGTLNLVGGRQLSKSIR